MSDDFDVLLPAKNHRIGFFCLSDLAAPELWLPPMADILFTRARFPRLMPLPLPPNRCWLLLLLLLRLFMDDDADPEVDPEAMDVPKPVPTIDDAVDGGWWGCWWWWW